MASSWITTPHLRPSSDTISSESHPGVLAHERAGPFAISATQICVKIAEDGQPSLPLDVVLDKRYTHSAPTVVTLQVKDGPPAPSDIHTNALTASPLLKHKQVARPQSPSSSSTFERQVLASVPTTNSQPVAPISAASNLTPPRSPDSPDAARPILNTDISMAGSTIGYSQLPALNQTLTQSPNPGRGQPARQAPRRSGTMGTFGTSAGNSIAQTEYTDMVFEPIPFRFNVMTCVFMWTVLAGFLVLPSSFPDIQTILGDSNKLSKVVRVARNIPLLTIGFTCCGVGAIGLCYVWRRFRHNYVWLLSSIFIPGMFSGLSGLISTFVNLYGSQQGVHYGTTTIATIAATGGKAGQPPSTSRTEPADALSQRLLPHHEFQALLNIARLAANRAFRP
ncbi:hypothetical protein F5888DRAFT_1803022 [Russula emetica]|nr:hypothetical protein F5888DRAFT_1803022 [Russula emetica]